MSEDRHYVETPVAWESYTLAQLQSMVHVDADPNKVIELAQSWQSAGQQLSDTVSDIRTALSGLAEYWQGRSAQLVAEGIEQHAKYVSYLGDTAIDMGRPILDAAGALKSAQDAMPPAQAVPGMPIEAPAPVPDQLSNQLPIQQPKPAVDPVYARTAAADGAASAYPFGGPLAAAVVGADSGATSAFGVQADQTGLKKQAVEVMRRFEAAALGIDQATPVFLKPEDVLKPNVVASSLAPSMPAADPAPVVPPADNSWAGLTGGAGGGTGAAASVGGFGGAGMAATPSATTIQPGGEVAAGEFGSQAQQPLAAAAGAGAGRPAGGGGGMGGGMPMGAGMGGGAGGSQGEHRRRFPFEGDDPFAVDGKASPPVIGL